MAKDNEQQTMEEYLLSQLDSMPGTIERNGKRYRLRISKSGNVLMPFNISH
jgi:hypothetical protein